MQLQVQIRDAQSAANAYAAMARFGAPTKLPANVAELTLQLNRVSGRGREVAKALQEYVDSKGFELLAEAMNQSASTKAKESSASGRSDSTARINAEVAAATGSGNLAPVGEGASSLFDPTPWLASA